MPQYPLNPESALFESLKETLTGDHAEGRYARGVLGEEVQLESAHPVVVGNIKKQIQQMVSDCGHIQRRSSDTAKALKAINAQGLADNRAFAEMEVLEHAIEASDHILAKMLVVLSHLKKGDYSTARVHAKMLGKTVAGTY